MPIVEQVNKVLFENKSAKEAVAELMLRGKSENSTLVWGLRVEIPCRFTATG